MYILQKEYNVYNSIKYSNDIVKRKERNTVDMTMMRK